ncbi:MAG TPA: hypothetical protein VM287_10395 [Egibacteraceae bacterium]|nr:hypothetical protein [Egibacteraceae bacterium]
MASETVNLASCTSVTGIDFPRGYSTVGHTGWKTASATFDVAGATRMTLVVRDVGDSDYDCAVLIDHLRFG